jgi:hypothetical protein
MPTLRLVIFVFLPLLIFENLTLIYGVQICFTIKNLHSEEVKLF